MTALGKLYENYFAWKSNSENFDEKKGAFYFVWLCIFKPILKKKYKKKIDPIHSWLLSRYEPDSYILEIGCGNGGFLNNLFHNTPYQYLTGVDFVKYENASWDVVCMDAMAYMKGQEDGSYDVIFAFDVLEHIPKEILLELFTLVNKKLRVGGCFVIRVPCMDTVLGHSYQYGDFSHVNYFSSGSMFQIASTGGYSNIDITEEPIHPHHVRTYDFFVYRYIAVPIIRFIYKKFFRVHNIRSTRNMMIYCYK
jgi:SAM-dependent methyltransferase